MYLCIPIIYKDTENLYTQVTQNILDPYGKTYTWDVKSTLMGLQRDEVAKMIVEIYDLPITWQEYVNAAIIQQDILMKTAQLLPGNRKRKNLIYFFIIYRYRENL